MQQLRQRNSRLCRASKVAMSAFRRTSIRNCNLNTTWFAVATMSTTVAVRASLSQQGKLLLILCSLGS
eukprot:5523124-Amphidinium_carterae.1